MRLPHLEVGVADEGQLEAGRGDCALVWVAIASRRLSSLIATAREAPGLGTLLNHSVSSDMTVSLRPRALCFIF
jgi:hypothetical protein